MSESTRATRWTIWLSLAAVSATAAVASYLHALAVVQAADGRGAVAWFIAGLADPAIFAASVNILDASRRGGALPGWSVVSVAVAVAVTLGMNVAAGDPRSVPPWLVNVWPPVAFLMALESLTSYARRGRGGKTPQTAAPVPGRPVPLSLDEAILAAAGQLSKRQIAAAFECTRPRVDKVLPPKSAALAADGTAAPPAAATPPGPPADPAGAPVPSPRTPPRPARDAAGARQAVAAARLPAPAARAAANGSHRG